MRRYILIFFLIGCNQSNDSIQSVIDLSQPKEENINTQFISKMPLDIDEFSYSNFSFIQANNSGIYVTPSTTIDGYVLYRYQISSNSTVEVKGVVKEGRGPKEKERISMSSKSISGDTLLFGSSGSKTLVINRKGELSEWNVPTYKLPNFGYSFSYNGNKLLIPSFNPAQSENLFGIFDIENQSINFSFPARVPYGFQPSIRNDILGETPIPGGFAVSFLGDRKVYILNYLGEIEKEIILGESDEIPRPYKVENVQESIGAKPHITKMEYFNDHLLVLMDNILWFIKMPSFEVSNRLKFHTLENEDKATVIDFSIAENYLYLRVGRKGIYFTETDQSWTYN
ncbi:MAG: hypothetical protein ABJR05_08940 [Balneola sp.]